VNQVWAADITYSAPSSWRKRNFAKSGACLEFITRKEELANDDRFALRQSESRNGGDPLYTSGVT